MLLTGARVIAGDQVLAPGWVRVSGNRVVEVGEGESPTTGEAVVDLAGAWLAPGFVDIHVHGGAGASYPSGDPGEARRVAGLHLRHGTTTTLASLVTARPEQLLDAVTGLAELVADGTLAGLHLEGPFLAETRCGAHDPALVRPPDRQELAGLLRAGNGSIQQVTLAPELPGALDMIRQLTDAGVVAAAGHTDATYEQGRAAFDAGTTVVTHLFNGMRPVHHREPGLATAALEDDRVTVELINDGRHLHHAVVRSAFAHVAASRVALVTDAMAAAGAGDGEYELGGQRVLVADGVARLAGGSSIAGSTLTMDEAVRRTVAEAGVSVVDAVSAASATPARVLGLDGVGVIAAGAQADLVVLDDDLVVRRVLRGGGWVDLDREDHSAR
ncbi:MAG: N-acetylglucosamine-6-phosphate deacetylase [Actinophytocola sp.]|nr:N-acetylglucosamine-6-phosphate deacetylase [Actinophytocola sp.]